MKQEEIELIFKALLNSDNLNFKKNLGYQGEDDEGENVNVK